ncbi:hypothetical protein HYQ45_012819 [Verticillium longisporum]|uniref:Uncharacterized protein n=2 Tax=Verticillium TaxID=1036719 RepID=A0A8I3AK06_VERLO|nr:hypothetical protein VdG2_08539 [Verticillium dahliae VDG2]KAG7126503.1 hypothetical protein HYQ45_012819 [Verticillium longisporum]KAH6705674.1 hypothetical protein EV126DRAFT_357603 [Verticillium dahliae]PNH26452.1 hypothetical protein BJF96_g10233 [Verticillium dahliae]PNH50000.1 hypothetical protein VD0003_g7160 [Verticillium dahliae]
MELSEVDWDECDELLHKSGILSRQMDYTSLFFSETYGFFLTLRQNKAGLYYTNVEDEKHYYELWTKLLPIIPTAPEELRQIFKPICEDGLKELRKKKLSFSRLCTFVKEMIEAEAEYAKNKPQ